MKTVHIGRMLKAFLLEQEGVTGIEYGLLAALIAAAIIVSVTVLGETVQALYDGVADQVSQAIS